MGGGLLPFLLSAEFQKVILFEQFDLFDQLEPRVFYLLAKDLLACANMA